MTVSFRAVGTWENGATGLTADEVVAIPAGTTTGDMMLLLAAWKDFSITAQVSGWTELTEFADGAVATGNGTGSMKVGVWYKEHSGSESNPTLDFSTTTGLVGEAVIMSFSRSLGSWETPGFTTASWSGSSGALNCGSPVSVPSGSAVVCMLALRDDSATFTRPTNGIGDNGAPPITWNGNYVESPATHASTTTGNDMAVDAGYRLVTSGSDGTTLQLNVTSLTATETGAALWVVVNDAAAAAASAVPRGRDQMQQLIAQ